MKTTTPPDDLSSSRTARDIKKKALQLGFSSCGIIPAEPFDEYRKSLDSRIKAFPQSEEIYKQLYAFVHPPEESKSIIVCISGYGHRKPPKEMAKHIGKFYLFDVRIAYTEEYRAASEFVTYLRTKGLGMLKGGVPDRLAAAKAGLGKFGRNNFIFTPEHGSYIFIHTWIVDKVLDYDPICEDILAAECSAGCLACVQACPTKALCDGYSMDRGKCIPHVANNTENLPDFDTMEKMGVWLYGCDACQDICPMNARKTKDNESFPLLTQHEEYTKPENILEMDEKTYVNVLNPRFWYIGEDGLWLWKCNALRVLINDGDQKYHHIIKKLSGHDDKRIREIAEWGCKKLGILQNP